MDALNTLRAILVGCAFIAALLLTVRGEWFPAGMMFVGILAHFGLWIHLRRQRRRDAANPITELVGR